MIQTFESKFMKHFLWVILFSYSLSAEAWELYAGNEQAQKFSPLQQITPSNVQKLALSWEFNHPDFLPYSEKRKNTAPEVTPIIAENKLIFCTPFNRVVALDPASGKLLWQTSDIYKGSSTIALTCRGVSYWKGTGNKKCSSRIFMGTLGGELKSYDVSTGDKCSEFGQNGIVDLKTGLGFVEKETYQVTSAPTVFEDLVITGASVKDNLSTEPPSGVLRAFDARSGKLVWAWDPVSENYQNSSSEKSKKTYGQYVRGSPNIWAPMSFDRENGLLFVPTGNPGADFFRGLSRPGIDAFGSSVVALNIRTGKIIWNFKTVINDLWDYDLTNAPAMYEHKLERGKSVPAIAFGTKMGHVFLLNRLTGVPIFPVKEMSVSTAGVKEEVVSPFQIIPTKPLPLLPHSFKTSELPLPLREKCSVMLKNFHSGEIFTPLTTKNSVYYPGSFSGISWGGVSINPQENILVTNVLAFPFTAQLIERKLFKTGDPQLGTPYGLRRGIFGVRKLGLHLPCSPGPIGELIAINLNDGSILWRKPLGEKGGIQGLPNSGGSLLTASGLIFIGASADNGFRAFDLKTGNELWKAKLKFGGMANPMTYEKNGTQFIVISDGGHPLGISKRGFRIMAYALKK